MVPDVTAGVELGGDLREAYRELEAEDLIDW